MQASYLITKAKPISCSFHMDMFAEAKREMQRLSQATGETVQICARDEGMMVVIGMAEGEGHFRVASNVGTRVPLNWTASGRLLLGHLPDDERRAAFADCAKPSHTGTAETDPDKLAAQSRADFVNRLSIQMSSSEFSVACIAAPRTGAPRSASSPPSCTTPSTVCGSS